MCMVCGIFLSCIVRKCRWKGNAKNFLVCKEETNVPVMRDKQVIVNGRVRVGMERADTVVKCNKKDSLNM